jgi:type I restriction enzyme S subunit
MSDAPSPARTTTLGAVCEIVGNLVDPRLPAYSSLQHVGGANIVSHTGELIDLKTAQEEELISGKYLFTPDDVLYSKIRPYLRKVALPGFTGLCSADIYPLRPRQHIRREYLGYLLLSDQFTEYANRVSNRAGMPKINREQLFAYEFALLSLTEQDRVLARIRGMMERVDEIAALRAGAVVEAQFLGSSVLGDLELASEWQHKAVGELILDSQNGRSIGESKQDGNGEVLTLTAVRDVCLDLEYSKPIRLEETVARQFAFKKGDVFVSRSNTRDLVGLSAVACEDSPPSLIYPDLLIRLTVDRSKVLPEYLAFALRFPTSRRQIRERAKGTSQSMVKISGASLREVQVPVPDSLREQEEVLAALEARYSMARSISEGLGDSPIVPLRQAILRKAFAGEL